MYNIGVKNYEKKKARKLMKEKIKFIKELAQSMNENKIETVKYEENNFEIMLSKKKKEKNVIVSAGAVPQNIVSNTVPTQEQVVEVQESKTSEETEEITGNKITSPMVGTFYSAPSPNMPPFVKEGVKVEKGQTLCIVEAMKLMNEVKSTVSGTVKKVLVKDGEAIKKGQTLMIIK